MKRKLLLITLILSVFTIQAQPVAPSGLSATATSSTEITLTWTDNSTDELFFGIERSETPGTGFTQINSAPADATTFVDDNASPNITYYYRITSNNSSGPSGYSNEASASIVANPPAAPSGLNASATSSTEITLTWMDNSVDEEYFVIERSTTSGSGFSSLNSVTSDVTTYVDANVSTGTTYYYRVAAHNTAGGYSAFSTEASATTPTPPNMPSDVSASAYSSTRIDITWTDNSTDETGFVIQRSTDAMGPFTDIHTTAANVVSYSDNGLSPSTNYFYRVLSTNANGNSGYDATSGAMTMGGPNAILSLALTTYKVYPNPAGDFISLDYEGVKEGLTIYLSDLTGRKVYSSSINGNSKLDLTEVNSGVYYMVIKYNDEIAGIEKIVKK